MSATDQLAPGHDEDVEAEEEHYGTRWGTMLKAFVPAVGLVGVTSALIFNGVIAASFVAESGTLRLTTSGLRANNIAIALQDVPKGGSGAGRFDARIAAGDATINGLCFTQSVSILGVPFTLKVTGGDNDPSTYEVHATGLVLDATGAQGQIILNGHTEVNKNAASLTVGNSGINVSGDPQRFGLQADSAVLKQVTAIVHDIDVPNALTVPTLKISVEPGDPSANECPPPPAPTN